jgi:hypothetical protein
MLNTRIKEHLVKIKDEKDLQNKIHNASAIQIHAFKEHRQLLIDDISVEILEINNKVQERKIIEAQYIRDFKPNLNNNTGFDLIF